MLLGGILAIIQSDRPEQIDYLCDLIRSNAALPDLAIHVENSVNADPEILQLSQQIMRSSDEQSQGTAGSKRFNEDRIRPQSLLLPPITVLAHPWTTLASDEVVSHLISLYFTWEQPCLQLIDKTAFLVDMKAGEHSRADGFCSPLLVSAVLAKACVSKLFSSPPPVLSIDLLLIDLLAYQPAGRVQRSSNTIPRRSQSSSRSRTWESFGHYSSGPCAVVHP